MSKGYTFLSQTDTEVIPNLIHYHFTNDNDSDNDTDINIELRISPQFLPFINCNFAFLWLFKSESE